MSAARWLFRLKGLFRRGRMEDDLSEELQFHLESEIEKNIKVMGQEDARNAALRSFGGLDQVKEECRDLRTGRFIEAFLQDVKYGFRTLRRNPGFTFVTVLTLALGIGANTAIFSIINAVLLRPLPYKDPSRLAVIWGTHPQFSKNAVPYPDFLDWKEQNHVFEQMGCYRVVGTNYHLTGHGDPQRLQATFVTSSLFSLLGVNPSIGRTFLPNEDQPDGQHVVILSHSLWEHRFNGDPNLIGKTVILNNESFTVVGVMPSNFKLPTWADLWMPMALVHKGERTSREYHPFVVIGRLKPDVTPPQAQAEMATLAQRIEQQYPTWAKGWGTTVIPLHTDLVGHFKAALLRGMKRSPGFTTVVVLSLALGIGANTAIFSLLDTVMLRRLPVQHPEELVELLQKYPNQPRQNGNWSRQSFEHFRDNNHVFSALTCTGIDTQTKVSLDGSEPETLIGESVPGNYFPVLGLKPALGRLIGPDDNRTSAAVAVVSWSYWKRRFYLDPAVLGKQIVLDGRPATVVGVAPRGFFGVVVGSRTDVWAPGTEGSILFGRLRSGVSLEQARAEMSVLYRFTLEELSRTIKGVAPSKVEVEPAVAGLSRVRDRFAQPLVLLMVVVGVLLLIACVNTANMLLARAAGRQREMAVRVGLGATRVRLVQQVMTESVLLSAVAALFGIFLAQVGTGVLVRIIASGREHERFILPVQLDVRLLAFTVGVALLTGLFFGLAPALHAFRAAPASALRQTGRAGETRLRRLFGRGLVAAQVASSVLLLSAAGLFLGYLSHLRNLDLGFQRDHVLLVTLDPERSGYKREQLGLLYEDLVVRLESIPGISSVSISAVSPIQGAGAGRFVTAEGRPQRPEDGRVSLNWVAPKYFETLGTPFLSGRDFQLQDQARARVTIINHLMARYYFGDASPVGKRITLHGDEKPYEVVGVVGNAKYLDIRETPALTMYFNTFQEKWLASQFALRTQAADPAVLAGDVRRTVREVLKAVPVVRLITLSDQVEASIVPERLIASLSGLFGALGSLLAAIGLFGLLAYTVAQRTNEIGIRMALGATRAAMSRMVLVDALRMSFWGLMIGMPIAYWGRRFATSMIPDLPLDSAFPIVFGALTMIAIALLAAYVPAHRAARVDPMEALRCE